MIPNIDLCNSIHYSKWLGSVGNLHDGGIALYLALSLLLLVSLSSFIHLRFIPNVSPKWHSRYQAARTIALDMGQLTLQLV